MHNDILLLQNISSVPRTALYVRVSTATQAERWSLPAQRKILRELAAKRGWDGILYDEGGASAETISARPVMQRMLADVAAHRIDMVAVVEMERLCRASDLRDWATITSTFREAGVLVSTPERTFNLETAEDDFEADLRGILSKREKRKLLERTKRGLNEAMDAGRFAGGRPMTGYKYDHATKKIVPDPETVPLVQRVFESDLSPWKLHRELGREGISLDYQTIRRIRSHPFYLGLRKNSKGELIKADWPAIIDKDLWQKHQSRRSATRRSTQGPAYLLSGIIRCGMCGGAVVGSPIRRAKSGRKLHVYKCNRSSRCPGGQLPGWLVDILVLDALSRHAGDPEALKKRYSRALDAAQDGSVVERRRVLEAEADELNKRRERLLDAVEQGILSEKDVRKRSKDLEQTQRAIDGELETLTAAENVPTLPDLQAMLELAEDTPNRELLVRLATSVEMDPKSRRLTITWRLGGCDAYQVPRFRGGPGRDTDKLIERARENIAAYRV